MATIGDGLSICQQWICHRTGWLSWTWGKLLELVTAATPCSLPAAKTLPGKPIVCADQLLQLWLGMVWQEGRKYRQNNVDRGCGNNLQALWHWIGRVHKWIGTGLKTGFGQILRPRCPYCNIQDHIAIFALGISMANSGIITKVKIIIIIIAIYCQEERHFPFMSSCPLISTLAAMFCRGSSGEKCAAALF